MRYYCNISYSKYYMSRIIFRRGVCLCAYVKTFKGFLTQLFFCFLKSAFSFLHYIKISFPDPSPAEFYFFQEESGSMEPCGRAAAPQSQGASAGAACPIPDSCLALPVLILVPTFLLALWICIMVHTTFSPASHPPKEPQCCSAPGKSPELFCWQLGAGGVWDMGT